MTIDIFSLVAAYGVALIGVATLLSCLAVPIPTSLLMLASGGFAASGDLSLPWTMAAALGGAMAGDNIGHLIGRAGGPRLNRWLERAPARARLRAQAVAFMTRWGGFGVFLSRWLVSPLGPYVNFASGLGGMAWPRFALWAAAGEIVWVSLYVGLGYGFADHVAQIATVLGNASGALAGAVVTLGLGLWLWRRAAPRPHDKTAPRPHI
ncbi:MAG: DedA family protein [Limimaricola sp.]|uniref:DedA family protein n=1 Tax=Limimaricola sp. TaxID=2211665 RepID=UPI001D702582|nr:VTT domain-containing protein [Limimaricola sp.]MBI1418336.1 DedA family protein [Limimaricola sp.]